MIKPGYYVATATSFEHAVTTQKGTPYIKVFFQILEGPEEGRQTAWSGYLTPNAAENTFTALRRAGWKGTKLDETMEGLGSVKVLLDIQEESYNGKTYSAVKWVNEYRSKGSGGIKPSENQISGDNLDKVNAALANVLLAVPPIEANPGAQIDGAATKLGGTSSDIAQHFGGDDTPF